MTDNDMNEYRAEVIKNQLEFIEVNSNVINLALSLLNRGNLTNAKMVLQNHLNDTISLSDGLKLILVKLKKAEVA